MADSSSRTHFKPTARRSRWFAPRQQRWDLAYLGWGVRYYGTFPSPCKRSDCWAFRLILRGTPSLVLPAGKIPTAPGDLFAFAIATAQGWTDKSDRSSEALIWQWLTPPRSEECTAPKGGYLHWKLPLPLSRQLQAIHKKCRQEVAAPDTHTLLALEHYRLGFELCLARLNPANVPPPASGDRFDLAVRWMDQNLAARHPLADLCEYLQISVSTLERMFQQKVGELPSNFFQRLKIRQATELLKDSSMSVKQIAYTLGYTHPNDFSRAFKTFTGKSPNDTRQEGGRA